MRCCYELMQLSLISSRNDSWCLGMKNIRDPELIKFEELLPFYVTKSLCKAEMGLCAQYIRQNTDAFKSYVFLKRVKDLIAGIKTKHHLNDGLLRLQDGLTQTKNKSDKLSI